MKTIYHSKNGLKTVVDDVKPCHGCKGCDKVKASCECIHHCGRWNFLKRTEKKS